MTLHRILNLETFKLGNVELAAGMDLATYLAGAVNGDRRILFRELTHWGHAMLLPVLVPAKFIVPWSGTLPEAKAVAVREMTAEDGEVLGDPRWETWRAGTETFALTFTPDNTFRRGADNIFNALGIVEAGRPREAPVRPVSPDGTVWEAPEPVEDDLSDDAPPAPEPAPESPEPASEPGFAREWLGAAIFGGVRRKVALTLFAVAFAVDPVAVAGAGILTVAKVVDRLRARRHDAPKVPDASVEG